MTRPLTPRERQVAELRVKELSYPEIGRRLGMDYHTVEGHMRHAYIKLGIENKGDRIKKLRAALALLGVLILCGWHIPILQHPITKTRNLRGDLVLSHHGHQHIYDAATQRDYQRYLSEERHSSHMRSSLILEEADKEELKKFLDWLDTHPAPKPFPNRY